MGLLSMTSRRIKRLIAWILSILVIILMATGLFYLSTVIFT